MICTEPDDAGILLDGSPGDANAEMSPEDASHHGNSN
jgi:hypothetical protein